MDPLSLISSCVSIVQGVEKIYKFAKDNVHLTTTVKSQLCALIARCSACKGIIEGIKLQAELDKDDHTKLVLLDHVQEPIVALDTAIKLINEKLRKIPRHVVFGKIVDNSIANCIKTFDDTLRVLQLALSADQLSVANSAREYTRDIKHDVQSLNAAIDKLADDISELNLFASEERLSQEERQADDARRTLVSWISSFDATQLYEVLAEKAHPGTGHWFLDQAFQEWLDSGDKSSRVLWLRGSSGSGKTTLITSAISHLTSKDVRPPVAYFFCSVSLRDTQTLANMLGSILVQLCNQKPELWHGVLAWRDQLAAQPKGLPRKPHPDDLFDILRKVASNFDSVLLVLDAPNECENPKRCLLKLGELINQVPDVKVLISSTPDLDAVHLKCNDILRVDMSLPGVNDDIKDVVLARMDDDEQLQDFPQHLKDRILDRLLERSKGSFRWAECQLSAITENATSEAGVLQTLENLSASIEELYTSILASIPNSQAQYLRRALLWLAFAVRQLDFNEIREAMILTEANNEVDPSQRFLPGKAEALLARCRMLVNYDAAHERVSLAHSSVQEYLLSESCRMGRAGLYHLDRDSSIRLLLRLSVGYLNRQALASGFTTNEAEYSARREDHPLLSYTAVSWPVFAGHAIRDEDPEVLQTEEVLRTFFDSSEKARGGNFGAWIQLYDPRHLYYTRTLNRQTLSTPLYYAARRGWVEIAGLILRIYGKQHLETAGGSMASTPLHVAAAYGRVAMVEMLLQHGANANERNGNGERGIAWAEIYGYQDIVQAYLKHGAVPLIDQERIDLMDGQGQR